MFSSCLLCISTLIVANMVSVYIVFTWEFFFYLVKSLVKIIWSCSCINNFFFTVLQVIFTFLQISQSHYHLIRGKGKVDKTSKATISYTRPYDYMDARDRTEILEAFFWFGQVQSNPKEFTWRPCSIPYNSCEFVYENIDKDCFKGFMVHYFL